MTPSEQPKAANPERSLRELSSLNGEPDWMLDLRLRSLRRFDKAPLPSWGGDTAEIPIDDISRYVSRDLKPVEGHLASPHLDNQDPDSRTPDSRHPQPAEASSGSHEAEAVFHRNSEDLQRLGVIFCDMGTALREHPELVKPYFGKIIALDDNKFAALNTSVWSGGTFIYVPPGVQVDQPLQAYFRLSVERMGQFERTLIIADEGSKVNYIEGCSAPVYTTASLRSAVVEVVVKPSASVTHTTIQNWSSNVFNLVTKRAVVEAEGRMQWIDGNIGSRLTMQYPSIWLAGPKASGEALSVACAGAGQHQDTGARMVHAAPGTTSKVVAKSVASNGGRSSFRSSLRVEDDSPNCRSHVHCDALVLDDDSVSDTFPDVETGDSDAQIGHDATVHKINGAQLFYLMSRGLSEKQAIGTLVSGFIEPVTRTLPMEYAVEWSRLIELQMEDSIG